MDFRIEKTISNFIENQFPQFYQEEGENFILFTKAYYEWAESQTQLRDSANNVIVNSVNSPLLPPLYQARSILEYRDIDNTLENFLEFFQKKYLYGIPFNIIANKRFLLKHILDVYRSKGTIQCYKLLFKLIYNEDIDVYLPGKDMLRVSDGTWIEPRYLEVTKNSNLSSLVGKQIVGVSSKTTAVVENYIQEAFNRDILNIIYLSNISPRGGDFNPGEKIVVVGNIGNTAAVTSAPTVVGSLQELTIVSGGQNYAVGDVVKIAHNDVSNGQNISFGVNGLLKITELSRGFGSFNFDVVKGGFGYMSNAATFVYKNSANGQGASFQLAPVSNTQTVEYNTDIICDYSNLAINAASYGFPGNTSANQSSNIGIAFSYTNNVFGTILNLTNIRTGNGYTQPANVFVRSCQYSKALPGNVSYNSTSNTITGTNTIFNWIYSNGDVIQLKANSSLSSSIELAVIKQVVSNTSIILYGPPSKNSTSSAQYRAAPVILPSNFALYEPLMYRADGTINGINEEIDAPVNSGNNIASKAIAVDSGKGYIEGELVKAYLYGGISNNISVINPGTNYSNGDAVIFAGGGAATVADGFVSTNSSGAITNVTLTYVGSGYTDVPVTRIRSANGSGAVLSVSITEFNTTSEIIGRVKKTGVGLGRGYWSTTRGFLNSDKYIQDSYYYQDFSYEIRVAEVLAKYKEILYNTFHTSGSELFGKFSLINTQASLMEVLAEQTIYNFSSDFDNLTADNAEFTADLDDSYFV